MTEKHDLDELARQYLDLWQEHLSDMAGDGEMAEAVAKSIELMNGSAAAFARMMTDTASKEPRDSNNDDGLSSAITQSSGTTAPGPPSGNPDDVLDQFSRRIAQLEQRIAKLESAAGASGKKSRANPARGRS
ncbi:MAG: hypothetical protein ISR45_07435 [Rhodospirillales bacterium]|nr:hypothetical protein [Rhodospirillales bacterium]